MTLYFYISINKPNLSRVEARMK